MNKITIIIVIILLNNSLKAQFDFVHYEYESDSLFELKIKNELLYPILDTVLVLEKNCSNFQQDLIFSIRIDTNHNSYEFHPAIYKIYITSYPRIYNPENVIGQLEYCDFQFIIFNHISNQNIFEITDNKKDFLFCIPWKKAFIHPETGIPILDIVRDRTNWIYWYDGNEFTLHKFGNECGYRE
ncbi:MAG: hypothetical protein PHT69_01000 [Bacteroidales bacterium]|nr:hypothetical protein [Bacteroidales bacterium]